MTAPLQVEVVTWLVDQLGAALPNVRFDSDRPADAALPWVTVERTGGPSDGHVIDIPTVTFNCFTDAQYGMQAAYELGYQVIAAIYALRGVPVEGAVITFVRTLSGPRRAAADNPNVRHVAAIVQPRIKTTFR